MTMSLRLMNRLIFPKPFRSRRSPANVDNLPIAANVSIV